MQSPHVQIHHRRAETRMAQQTTDGQQIDSRFEKSCRIRMTKSVGRDMFENARVFGGHFEHLLNRRWLEWRVGRLAGKQIHFRTISEPVLAKCDQQSRSHRDHPRLLAFARVDSYLHPLAVDVADLQMSGLVQTKSARILQDQKRAMLVTLHTRQQQINFFATQNRRQLFMSAKRSELSISAGTRNRAVARTGCGPPAFGRLPKGIMSTCQD